MADKLELIIRRVARKYKIASKDEKILFGQAFLNKDSKDQYRGNYIGLESK
jgi:hypothetical protein